MKDLKHLIYFEHLLDEAANELVMQAVSEGKHAVGYTCYHMPEVLLNLDNCFSVRMRAPRTGSLEISTYYMTNYLCGYTKALVERGIEGGYQFLDAMIGVDACSMMNRAMEHFEILKVNEKPNFFVTHCDIPYKITDYTLDSYVKQMRIHVLDKLTEVYGVDTSDAAIRQAVAEHNEVCSIISEMAEMRKAENPVITGYEFHVLNLVTYTCPKDLILPYLRETLEELKARQPDEKPAFRARVAIVGSEIDDPQLTKLIEGCGALVVLFLCSYLLSGVVTKPVGAAWAQQEQFLSDASHELKTPLTVILSSAELLEQSASPEQEVYVDNIRAEGRRMKALVEDMLTLFRAQKNAGSPPDTVTDLSEAAVTAALRFEPVAFEAGHVLDYDIAPSLPVRGDGAKLGQALAVLLDNAVKYAAPGTPIRLTAVRQGSRAVVSVTDQGPDIPSDKLPRIFDRFYRADDARTDGDSFGLGLPIAKAIVDAHRGVLRCDSSGGVTTFSISLPLTAGKQERGTDHV